MGALKNKIIKLARSENNPLRAAFLFGFASLSSWMPVFNLWLEDCGLKGSQIGFIAAIPWITMLFVQPLWGIVADKFGKMNSFRISVIAATLLFLVFPFAGLKTIPIALITFALAIFNNPVLPFLDSISLDHIDERKNISYSNIRFWGAPGYGLGAFLTGLLIPHFGVKVAFFTAASFLVLSLISLQFFAPAQVKNKGIDLEFKNLADILPDRKLLIFLFIITIVSIGQSAITFFLSIYMREIGATPQVTGSAIGVQGFSELPFYFVAAWLLSRTKPGIVVIIAILATAIRLSLYSINSNPNLVIFIETMNGMTWTLLWIASVEYVNKIIPATWRTTGQSLLWAAYFGAGAILGNVLSGSLYGSMTMKRVYTINCIMILVIFIFALFVLARNNKKSIDND